MTHKKALILILILLAIAAGLYAARTEESAPDVVITSFEGCVATGNIVMKSYPRACRAGDDLFVEDIGNGLDKRGLIRADSPRPNQTITSPLAISGEARGYWFFEASFPIVLTDWDGLIIAQGFASAQDEWMTEDFVPFQGTLEFDSPIAIRDTETREQLDNYLTRGTLILQKDNPSGLPENDDTLEIPIRFAE